MTSLPPLLMTSEKESFARKTIQERKPLIIDRILSHFDYTPEIRKDLLNFKRELIHEPICPLHENTSDRDIWDRDLEFWSGKTWLEVPWFFAETYFFRRVLEVVKYFQPGPWHGQDPFSLLKDNALFDSSPIFNEIYPSGSRQPTIEDFQAICYRALWGNRGDLSNLNFFTTDMGTQSESILLNQSVAAFKFLQQKPAKIAYIMDNAGKELLFDLAFIDYLLDTELAESITCYLKNQPFFVSDAMIKDFKKSLVLLKTSQSSEVKALNQRLTKALMAGTLTLKSPPFFTTSHMYRELPQILNTQIGDHDLAILKGDVNYRRLFGDRHWDPTTPVAEAGGYFPTSFLSLRTLKAELILGVSQASFQKLENEAESNWRINGQRGMITFHHRL